MSFHELRLAEPLVRAVAAEGYTTPTPIQTQAIPAVLSGKDVLGCAQTGTGKTCAFALPILHRLSTLAAENGSQSHHGKQTRNGKRSHKPNRSRRPRALVLCPTRELATQIFESFGTYGRNLPLRHTVVFGGVSQFRQVRQLRAGTDVLVATPGRLLDLINQGIIDLGAIEVLVLDEADRMLDMGFIHDIRKVIEQLPAKRQTLLFSATMPREIRRLADSILYNPISVQVAAEAATVDTISQHVYLVERKNKPILLERLLRHQSIGRTLIFTRTKHGADKLVKILRRSGIEAGAIHGNKNQGARTRALDSFKSGKTPILIATDIASRGIDVDEITHVINYDMPHDSETYVHRIGRTARAGASGVAVSFCDYDELKNLRAIERLIRKPLEVIEDAPDLAFDISTTPAPRKRQRHQSPPKSSNGTSRHRRGRPGEKTKSSRRSAVHTTSKRSRSTDRSLAPRKQKSKRPMKMAG